MERLQAAIEKARKTRGPASAGSHDGRSLVTPQDSSCATLWAELPNLTFDDKRMSGKRVQTLAPGQDSAPFDLLRTKVLQLCSQNSWKRVAIVSPQPNCGKSTTTLNLAFGLERQKDLHSMVFDFDMRRAGLTRMLGVNAPYDISQVLTGEVGIQDQAMRYADNVAFALSGTSRTKNPSEILQSKTTAAVLDDIQDVYQPDLMLFDMPPLMASDDNFGFLKNVDCALIMVAAEETKMSQVDLAERQVAELTNVLGVVLNKCRHTAHSQYAYDYYAY